MSYLQDVSMARKKKKNNNEFSQKIMSGSSVVEER